MYRDFLFLKFFDDGVENFLFIKKLWSFAVDTNLEGLTE